MVATRERPPRSWHGDGLPVPDRRRLGRLTPLLAGALPERLPFLAGSRLCCGCPFSRDHRGYPWDLVGYRLRGCADVPVRGGRGGRHAGGTGRPRRERERMIGA